MKVQDKSAGREELFMFREVVRGIINQRAYDLHAFYKETIVPKLIKKFGYTDYLLIPKILKISVNRGIGKAVKNPKELASSLKEFADIVGQRPCVTKARKSIAGFKVREGMDVGLSVTLRREKMYAFLGKLIHINLPMVRDFRGLKATSFDGYGNYSFGLEEQSVFPEIPYMKIIKFHGFDITIVTSANTDIEGRFLLESFGFPIGYLGGS